MFIALLSVLIVLGLVGGLSFAGLWLCWQGLSGSIVDHHPHCAHCRYDLYGHVVLPEQCPECGGNLWLLDAIAVGQRKRGFDRVAAGVMCLALGFLPIAWMMHDSASASDVITVAAQTANQTQVRNQPRIRPAYRTPAARVEASATDQETLPQAYDAQQPPADGVRHARISVAQSDLLTLLDEEHIRAGRAAFALDTPVTLTESALMPRYKSDGSAFLPSPPQLEDRFDNTQRSRTAPRIERLPRVDATDVTLVKDSQPRALRTHRFAPFTSSTDMQLHRALPSAPGFSLDSSSPGSARPARFSKSFHHSDRTTMRSAGSNSRVRTDRLPSTRMNMR